MKSPEISLNLICTEGSNPSLSSNATSGDHRPEGAGGKKFQPNVTAAAQPGGDGSQSEQVAGVGFEQDAGSPEKPRRAGFCPACLLRDPWCKCQRAKRRMAGIVDGVGWEIRRWAEVGCKEDKPWAAALEPKGGTGGRPSFATFHDEHGARVFVGDVLGVPRPIGITKPVASVVPSDLVADVDALHATVEAQWQALAERSELDPVTVAYCKEIQDSYVCQLLGMLAADGLLGGLGVRS